MRRGVQRAVQSQRWKELAEVPYDRIFRTTTLNRLMAQDALSSEYATTSARAHLSRSGDNEAHVGYGLLATAVYLAQRITALRVEEPYGYRKASVLLLGHEAPGLGESSGIAILLDAQMTPQPRRPHEGVPVASPLASAGVLMDLDGTQGRCELLAQRRGTLAQVPGPQAEKDRACHPWGKEGRA